MWTDSERWDLFQPYHIIMSFCEANRHTSAQAMGSLQKGRGQTPASINILVY